MYSRISRIDQKRVKNCPKLQMNIKELLTTKKGEKFIFKQHVLRFVYKSNKKCVKKLSENFRLTLEYIRYLLESLQYPSR